MKYFDFVDHQLSDVFKGNWQLTGGYGVVNKNQALEDLFAYTKYGVSVFDVGDILTTFE